MVTIQIELADALMARLQAKAQADDVHIGVLIEEAIEIYLDETADDPTKAEILASIRDGMLQALHGEGRPAHDVLDELEAETEEDANKSYHPSKMIFSHIFTGLASRR